MSGAVRLAGRRAVLEALKAGRRRVRVVYLAAGSEGGLAHLRDAAERAGARIVVAPRRALDALAGGERHQGVVAEAEPGAEASLDGLLAVIRAAATPGFLVALDEVSDPRNAGAVVRTAEAAGANGVVMTLHRTAPGGPGMGRASAGAVEHLPVVRVVNLRAALERLKREGFWVVGADAAGARPYTGADLTRPVALVLGAEARGLRDLTRRTCDELVRIPMRGKVASLNVSAAAAILCYEVVRQRGVQYTP